jgi:hypothetical protein
MKKNNLRKSCKDVFNAFLVENSSYAGELEMPKLKKTDYIPNELIAFSKCKSSKDINKWVAFFEDDWLFERLWRNPNKYLEVLKSFNGVILPDFSLYRDMPLVMQYWNIYRSRAIGVWLQKNGVKIIPNIRFGDERTFNACCLGIERGGTIAIGTYGSMKDREDREIMLQGIKYVVKELVPSNLVIFGSLPKELREDLQNQGINIIIFTSDFAKSRKAVKS